MSIQNMKRSETTEQIALFNWAKRTESILPELALMYHVPNEGKRSNGGILKAAGLKSGVLWGGGSRGRDIGISHRTGADAKESVCKCTVD